ncbi:MAG: alpha/beta fold hydrolase [Bacteroidota bacterium]
MKIKVIDQVFFRCNESDKSKESIWLLHGFADSGLAYKEIFDSPLAKDFNIYVADLPGFGASPIRPAAVSIKQQSILLSQIILKETNKERKVNIVAHSLGALIGTWICQSLKDNINFFFNIEGNLTEADSYFSSKPLQFDSAEKFSESFHEEIFEIAKLEERYKRYYSSLRFAKPEAMMNWSRTSMEHIKDDKCGHEFNKLDCKKLYIWGDVDTPKETQTFIKKHKIPNRLYTNIGHWHMVENSVILYKDLHEKLLTT